MLVRFIMLIFLVPLAAFSFFTKRVKMLYVYLVIMHIWAYWAVIDLQWYQSRGGAGPYGAGRAVAVFWAITAAMRILMSTNAALSSAESAGRFRDVDVGKRCVRVKFGKSAKFVTTRILRSKVADIFRIISTISMLIMSAWWGIMMSIRPSSSMFLFPVTIAICSYATYSHYAIGKVPHDDLVATFALELTAIRDLCLPPVMAVIMASLGKLLAIMT